MSIPAKQKAIQLTGPDTLALNNAKAVPAPGPYQVLCKVEAAGLCFSDLKLLKQFSTHARKTDIQSGIEKSVLDEIPSYVPESLPTVPGHEAVVRAVLVGSKVKDIKPGSRFLVQTDYRWLPTANSNGSFGYNFEGALQEYVLMDTRVITSPQGDSMLIPASEKLAASAIALVEPWACVEDAYVSKERQGIKQGGKMLIVAEAPASADSLNKLFKDYGTPGSVTLVGSLSGSLSIKASAVSSVADLPDAAFDDIICFGASADTVSKLFWKLGPRGLINIVQCNTKFNKPVTTTVGRVHYGGVRIIGTPGSDPVASMKSIPQSGEIRKGDKIHVVGAGGPMGVMHVIRNICQGIPAVKVYAADLDDNRLEALGKLARPLAQKNGVEYIPYNSGRDKISEKFDYVAMMAPVGALVAASVGQCSPKAIINIFAGIPATVTAEIDLDTYIANSLYFIGTSGSVLDDMKTVLAKVESGSLDTNLSVAAISGLEAAAEGIRAVEKALIPGKILVYPQCTGLGLTKLTDLPVVLPEVGRLLDNGNWTKAAEDKLLEIFSRKD